MVPYCCWYRIRPLRHGFYFLSCKCQGDESACLENIWLGMIPERRSQRLNAILRSSLYSHFSESLSGIATIRAYGEEDRFLTENRDWVDIENRAYWLTVTNRVCGFPLFAGLSKSLANS
jgi:hypothetical protein